MSAGQPSLLLLLAAYLGGVLTILSPCILPVLPFVFVRAGQPFLRSGLPLLLGMALGFMVVGTLATLGGGWAVRTNVLGRGLALALLALFGVGLMFPGFADRAMQPLVAVGSRLLGSMTQRSRASGASLIPSIWIGVATGLVWAPCAGPILGLVLTIAAQQGTGVYASLLLLAYVAGAGTSLALALLAGGQVLAVLRRSLGAGEWIRRGAGAVVLCAVVVIALGLDTGVLTRLSVASTSATEQSLLDRFEAAAGSGANGDSGAEGVPPSERSMPSLQGAVSWINSPPLSAQALRGKVVLINFWTYSCINCLRALPYVRAWAERYKDRGLVVIGVHTPEFAFEKNLANVGRAVRDLKLGYPIAVDSDHAVWQAFDNHYWPAFVFVDAQGRIRQRRDGEGAYAESEALIRQMLLEAGAGRVSDTPLTVNAPGAQAEADTVNVKSPETYLGYELSENFASAGGLVKDSAHVYGRPATLALNEWGLQGDWTVGQHGAALNRPLGRIAFRFHARDLHLVMGPAAGGNPVRFRVSIDGRPPGAAHGFDIDDQGFGTVEAERLYQLVRQPSPIGDRLFEIEFLDPGVQAFVFTFG